MCYSVISLEKYEKYAICYLTMYTWMNMGVLATLTLKSGLNPCWHLLAPCWHQTPWLPSINSPSPPRSVDVLSGALVSTRMSKVFGSHSCGSMLVATWCVMRCHQRRRRRPPAHYRQVLFERLGKGNAIGLRGRRCEVSKAAPLFWGFRLTKLLSFKRSAHR